MEVGEMSNIPHQVELSYAADDLFAPDSAHEVVGQLLLEDSDHC